VHRKQFRTLSGCKGLTDVVLSVNDEYSDDEDKKFESSLVRSEEMDESDDVGKTFAVSEGPLDGRLVEEGILPWGCGTAAAGARVGCCNNKRKTRVILPGKRAIVNSKV
jgi:hypothetical protein